MLPFNKDGFVVIFWVFFSHCFSYMNEVRTFSIFGLRENTYWSSHFCHITLNTPLIKKKKK